MDGEETEEAAGIAIGVLKLEKREILVLIVLVPIESQYRMNTKTRSTTSHTLRARPLDSPDMQQGSG